MLVRFRLAPSANNLFAAPALATKEISEMPRPGSGYEDESGAYTVVKVMDDVGPDHEQAPSGPIVYVVKVTVRAAQR